MYLAMLSNLSACPLPFVKGRGIKGSGLVNNLIIYCFLTLAIVV